MSPHVPDEQDRLQAVEQAMEEMHGDYARLEDRTRGCEQLLQVHKAHLELVTRQISEMVMSVQSMHKELRQALIDAAEKRSEAAERLAGHIAHEEAWMRALVPDGDADAHRRDHELRARQAKSDADMWRDVRVHLIKQGTAGALLLLGGMVVLGGLALLAQRLGIKAP
jgi:hypothetical protein